MAKLPKPKFNLRLRNAKTETLISLVLRYRGQRLVYSTGYSIHPKDWDFKTQRPIQQERRPDLFTIKRNLDDLTTYCIEITVAAQDSNKGIVSTKEFKRQLDIKMCKVDIAEQAKGDAEPKKERPTFLEFLDILLDEMEAYGMRHSSWDTFDRHRRVINHFARDVRYFDYEDVDWAFRNEFIDWLASRNISLSYGNKTLSALRQFLERAKRRKFHTNTDYQGMGWMVTQKKAVGQLVTLTPEELEIFGKLELTGFAKETRDLFLIGAGTGQRFSDYSRYQPEHFYTTMNGIPILSIISKKTDSPAKVPLNIFPWLVPLLEEYNYTSPPLPMHRFNAELKKIAKAAGFDKNVFIVQQYMGRRAKVVKSYRPKFKQITSHTCRRSFATNLYRMGYRLSQIMPMTGHATESQLREYIGIDSEQNAEEVALSIMKRRESGESSSGGNLRIVNY